MAEPDGKNGTSAGRLLDALNAPVAGNLGRGALWAVIALAILSLLKNELGVKLSAETTGWLLIVIQTMAGYWHKDK